MKQRFLQIDFLRGIAVFLMIIFHTAYHVNYFGIYSLDIRGGFFFPYFRTLIVFLFLMVVGIGLYIANKNSFNLKKNLFRLSKLFIIASLISIGSYIAFPAHWVYFGIIHLIFVCSLIGLFFIKTPKVSLMLGSLILVLSYFDFLSMSWLYHYLKDPLNLPLLSRDVANFFPWIGATLIGIFIAYKQWFLFPLKENRFSQIFGYMGKHALAIYIIHIPIVFAVVGLISKI